MLLARQGWMHCILYVLFENAMGIVKLGAVVAGELPCLRLGGMACAAQPLQSCAQRWPHWAGAC